MTFKIYFAEIKLIYYVDYIIKLKKKKHRFIHCNYCFLLE